MLDLQLSLNMINSSLQAELGACGAFTDLSAAQDICHKQVELHQQEAALSQQYEALLLSAGRPVHDIR